MEGLVISDAVKDLIINIINIIILFVIVRSLVYKPVRKFLDARTARIDALQAQAAEQLQAALPGLTVALYNSDPTRWDGD